MNLKIIKNLYPLKNSFIDWEKCIEYYVIENQIDLSTFWESDFYELDIYVRQYNLKLEGINIAFAFGYASAKKGKMLNIFKKKKSVKEMEKMKDDLKKIFNF